ncbi:hypothetical protein [Acinetobacter sp. YH12140]|uniref:hypothetical protein n=1 Tax=Acinetobacter sp. YH12140 TaxID=2601124 RepID=UPI0015D13936|nr:hypothetical protein [Acinetobacter sp. YH12140]
MTTVITNTAQIDEMGKLKAELIKETVQSLLMRKNQRFDLSTEKGIDYAVNCTFDDLLQQKIQNGEIQVIEQGKPNGVMQ